VPEEQAPDHNANDQSTSIHNDASPRRILRSTLCLNAP
jgi:hypothetical protein